MLNPWLGMGSVLGALGGLTIVLRLWQQCGGPHPEIIRKLLHVGMGLVTLVGIGGVWLWFFLKRLVRKELEVAP